MSTEREASSINATSTSASATRGGAKVSRSSRGAVQQGLNTQQYQERGLQASSQLATEGMHLAGGSTSRGGAPTVQQYAGNVQQEGTVVMGSSTSRASAGANNMQTSMMMSNINTSTPCAACKLLRRRCAQECPFAPYFSPHEPQRFASVHKIYGASNVSKMLMEVPEIQRGDAANSLVYEANARLRDPVYGCMGVVSTLQQQAQALQAELNAIRGELMRYRACHAEVALHHQQQQQQQNSSSYSIPTSSSTIAPPHDHQQDRGHPLSIVANPYLNTSDPTNILNSTSTDARETKNCLMPWS